MIKHIELTNFRQFDNLNLDIDSKYVIISGKNACGKTTILEALSYASVTKSHRTNNNKEAIKYNEKYAISKVIENSDEYKIVLSNLGKKVSINKNEIKKISDYIGKLNTVFFSPNDLDIITGSPSLRRSFINQAISLIDSSYLILLNQYNKLLDERNACLKELDLNSDKTYLRVLSKQLSEIGSKIIESRRKIIEEFNLEINSIHKQLNENEEIVINYSSTIQKEYYEYLLEKENSEIITHSSNYGPHRDDLIINLNGKDTKSFASQGQIRSVVLSLKIMLCRIIYKYKNKYPVLLLDDVLSELDEIRQNNLLKMISELGQTFITVTDVKLIKSNILEKYQLINLDRG